MLRRLAPLALVVALLTGCTGLPESGDKGYVTGDGLVSQLAVDDRESPIALRADDLEGNEISLSDYRGRPLVLVVWFPTCVGCRVEQADVNQAAAELDGTAEFLGLHIRGNVAAALSYEREQDVKYPSIDAIDGQALQAFSGTLSPYTVPAFVVLDAEGRIAASIIGQLPSKLTLVDLVKDVASGTMGNADG